MNGNEIIQEIEKIFPDAECELHHESDFQLLVAVVLSAQTTDVSVNKITPALFAAYPDAFAMAKATPEEIEPYIRSIGLFRNKARNLSALSQALVENFNGVVPSSYKDLQSLPGVGRKTANVVRSVAFHIPSLAVDTHVARIAKRLGLAEFGDTPDQVEAHLQKALDRDTWNQAHHDLIFFGRYFCTARKPNCAECPFQDFCRKAEFDAWNKERKNMTKKNKEIEAAKQLADEANILAEAANAMINGENKAEKSEEAASLNNPVVEARVLVESQSAIDEAAEKIQDEIEDYAAKHPAADQVLEEANVLEEAMNDIHDGQDKSIEETDELVRKIGF